MKLINPRKFVDLVTRNYVMAMMNLRLTKLSHEKL
jgi:hypothetical protein